MATVVWVVLRLKGGGEVTINPANICYLKPVAGATEVGLSGGFKFEIDQSDTFIRETIAEAEDEG